MPLPAMRQGEPLQVKKRDLDFSFWPVTRNRRRYGLQHSVFAVSPWAVLQGAVNTRCDTRKRPEAVAFLAQARDFYSASQGGAIASNPLLLYYAFLNLAKTFILTSGQAPSLVDARHGLTERRRPASDELAGADIVVVDDPAQQNVFPLLIQALGFPVPANGTRIAVADLLPEVVVGHRLWRQAGGAERYVPVNVVLAHDPANQTVWANLFVQPGDLTRFNITHRQLIDHGGLAGQFREAASPIDRFLLFEEIAPLAYGARPSDQIADVVKRVKPHLWRIAASTPPYRRYYLYVSATRSGLPQLVSLYALIFYFGSITRYRPHIFNEVLSGPYGAFISEFVAAQPEQLLYLLASEVCEREVAKPAII
jgi:hypothetical protein